MKKLMHFLVFSVYLLFLYGCASYSSPTGGEKDSKPPVLVKTYPASKSTNYTNGIVELEFDEYVSIENIKQELLITPSAESDFTTKLTKKGVRLEFEKRFKPNTTYTLNFRNAIKDITEKNVAKNIKVVFSTGNIIDSLSITGNIKDLQTNKNAYDAIVSLYLDGDTNNIFNSKPYYFTRTDSAGHYALENLKDGKYTIYALVDKNNDLKYNEKLEKIGFFHYNILLDSNLNNIDIKLSRIDKTSPSIIDTDADPKTYTIEFNEGLADVTLEPSVESKELKYMREGENKIILYKTTILKDSLPIKITAKDSANNVFIGSVKVFFPEAKKLSEKKASEKKPVSKLTIQTNPKDGEAIEHAFIYTIGFDKPIQTYDLSKVRLINDTTMSQEILIKDFVWDKYQTSVKLIATTKASREVRIQIPANTFISIDGDTNIAIITNHKIKLLENYGSISGLVDAKGKSNYIIQLLTTDYKIVAELRNIKQYRFNYLNEGNYYIRVINDANGNGIWDSANLKDETLAEDIIFHNETIKVKQNWDIENINLSL